MHPTFFVFHNIIAGEGENVNCFFEKKAGYFMGWRSLPQTRGIPEPQGPGIVYGG